MRGVLWLLSEYLSRIEKTTLDILESVEPIDKTITLWWGFDGIRLNEDGTTEWVSRRKPAESIFYQPCQSIWPWPTGVFFDQTQSTKAQIDAIMAQAATTQTSYLIQQCCIQYPTQYPLYYY